jgi:hypothetical protein
MKSFSMASNTLPKSNVERLWCFPSEVAVEWQFYLLKIIENRQHCWERSDTYDIPQDTFLAWNVALNCNVPWRPRAHKVDDDFNTSLAPVSIHPVH